MFDMFIMMDMLTTYELPDGRRVQIEYGVCRNASTVDYTLADGRIVTAVYVPRYVTCAHCWKQHDSQVLPSHECKEMRAFNRPSRRRSA